MTPKIRILCYVRTSALSSTEQGRAKATKVCCFVKCWIRLTRALRDTRFAGTRYCQICWGHSFWHVLISVLEEAIVEAKKSSFLRLCSWKYYPAGASPIYSLHLGRARISSDHFTSFAITCLLCFSSALSEQFPERSG